MVAQVLDTVITFSQMAVITLGAAVLLGVETEAGFQWLGFLSALSLPLYGGLVE